MLNDGDKWPVACAECGHVTHEKIGLLKGVEIVTCARCGNTLSFDHDAFIEVLGQLKATVNSIAGSARLTRKV